jgi:molybdopterin-binding protein
METTYFKAISRDLTAERKHPKLGAAPRMKLSSTEGNEDIRMATKLSARNKIEGKIVELEVDGVMAHVTVQVGKNMIESVITRRSAEEMKLKVGDRVSAVIKSTEVMLQKG